MHVHPSSPSTTTRHSASYQADAKARARKLSNLTVVVRVTPALSVIVSRLLAAVEPQVKMLKSVLHELIIPDWLDPDAMSAVPTLTDQKLLEDP